MTAPIPLFPQTALATAADAILASLPAGSGKSPITGPHDPAQVSVIDTQFGGTRVVDYYDAYPVADASGLLEWTAPDTAQILGGLNQAQVLAANVLIQGNKNWSADYFPPTKEESEKALALEPLSAPPQHYTPAPGPIIPGLGTVPPVIPPAVTGQPPVPPTAGVPAATQPVAPVVQNAAAIQSEHQSLVQKLRTTIERFGGDARIELHRGLDAIEALGRRIL